MAKNSKSSTVAGNLKEEILIFFGKVHLFIKIIDLTEINYEKQKTPTKNNFLWRFSLLFIFLVFPKGSNKKEATKPLFYCYLM